MSLENIKNNAAPLILAAITAAAAIKILAGRSIFLIGCLVPGTVTPLVGTIIAISAITLGTAATYYLTKNYKDEKAKILFGVVITLFVGTLAYGSIATAATITIPTLAIAILFDAWQDQGILKTLFSTSKTN